jgi:pimeloyl-ACP methyl ester carboxylesterase
VVARITLFISLVLTTPAWAQDPCRPTQRPGLQWHTVSGCLTVPWDDNDAEAGEFPLYIELSQPKEPPLGNLLVFHGGPAYPRASLQEAGPLWEGLRAHFRIAYFHQRGAGYSARVPSRAALAGRERFFTLAHLLADARHVHQELLGGEATVVMGKSAGGFLALLFALEYPEQTQRLILAATTAHHAYISQRNAVKAQYLETLDQRYPGFLALRARAADALNPAILAQVPALRLLLARVDILENVTFDLSYTLAGQLETVAIVRDVAAGRFELLLDRVNSGRKTLRSTGMESLAVLNHITCREFAFSRANADACEVPEAAELYDIRDRLTQVQIPTLILGGRFDPILPPVYQEEIAQALGENATVHILELSAHMIFQEQPQGSAKWVLDFLAIPGQQAAQSPAL